MGDDPINNGGITADRRDDGKFAPGNAGGGKPRGARNRVTVAVQALLDGQHEELTQVAISKALEGDIIALRLCLDRIAPPRRDGPVSVALPAVRTAADAVEASAVLLEAVAAGEVTPDEAGRVMALLTAHKGLLEAGELEQRIAALEGKAT